jgi:hypothetical protein
MQDPGRAASLLTDRTGGGEPAYWRDYVEARFKDTYE